MTGALKISRFREPDFALLKEGLCAEIVTLGFESVNRKALWMFMGIFIFINDGRMKLDVVCIFMFYVG